MLDLLVNALRMRPDRILVGEIRKKQQAEVLFEAMHTGHSVYSTLHADTAQQTVRRLVNPPIDVPKTMVDAVDVNVVMFRDRRRNFRRAMEVAEITENGEDEIDADVIYEWQSKEDEIEKKQESQAIFETLQLHAGMTREEMHENIEEKKRVLKWMEDKDVNSVDGVGEVIAEYYSEKENVLELVENDMDPGKLSSGDN
jgi:flagellar protein FlaI